MPWALVFLLGAFLLQGAVLACLMHALVCLSDLENDFVNPHDSCKRVNAIVRYEVAAQAALLGFYLLAGFWLLALLQLPITLFHARCYYRRELMMDVTEAFRELPREKRQRLVKLGYYLLCLLFVILRLVQATFNAVLHGKRAAAARNVEILEQLRAQRGA